MKFSLACADQSLKNQRSSDGNQLHRFYLDQSSFVHGGTEVGSEKAVAGQKAIHDKIMSLGLNQVLTRIKQVESLSTLAGGIVVQVTGDLSVGGKPSRAFVQTFVLAPTTPKVYYVHNSIFRYQDDDLVSESEAEDVVHTSDHVGEGGQDECPQSCDSTTEGKAPAAITEYQHTTKETGDQERPDQEETTTWESFGEGEGTDTVQNGQHGEEDTPPQPQEYTLEPAVLPGEGEEPAAASFPPAPESREVETEQLQQPQQKQPKTFASCLSKSVGAGTKQAPASSVPTSSKPTPPTALPQRESKSRRPPPSDAGGRGPPQAPAPPVSAAPSVPAAPPTTEPAKKPAPAAAAPVIPDTFQVFVGGLPSGTTEQDLKGVFEKFGNVTEVRVNSKNFAFVIFDSEDAAKSVITCKEPFYLNTKRLNIEPKKERVPFRGPRSFTSGGGGDSGYGRRQGPPMGNGGVRRDREPRERPAQKPATAGGSGGGSGKRFAPSH
ncbi:hypothetical protein EMCRGX_G017533 [Ephydatia muelleri]